MNESNEIVELIEHSEGGFSEEQKKELQASVIDNTRASAGSGGRPSKIIQVGEVGSAAADENLGQQSFYQQHPYSQHYYTEVDWAHFATLSKQGTTNTRVVAAAVARAQHADEWSAR